MIRLLGESIGHYEDMEEDAPGSVVQAAQDLVAMARMLSGVEHSRSMLRIEAQRKERDLYLSKSDTELVSIVLAVPELRRLVLDRMAVDAPELFPKRKELASG